MATLTNKNMEVLSTRGIAVRNDSGTVQITLTTKGVCWLLNFLNIQRNVGATLSLKLLNDLARFQPVLKSWRQLRVKAASYPVSEGTEYFQLAVYLDGTPPRAFHAFPPDITQISNIYTVPPMEGGAFKVRNDQDVNIEFSTAEAEQLRNGDLIVIEELA